MSKKCDTHRPRAKSDARKSLTRPFVIENHAQRARKRIQRPRISLSLSLSLTCARASDAEREPRASRNARASLPPRARAFDRLLERPLDRAFFFFSTVERERVVSSFEKKSHTIDTALSKRKTRVAADSTRGRPRLLERRVSPSFNGMCNGMFRHTCTQRTLQKRSLPTDFSTEYVPRRHPKNALSVVSGPSGTVGRVLHSLKNPRDSASSVAGAPRTRLHHNPENPAELFFKSDPDRRRVYLLGLEALHDLQKLVVNVRLVACASRRFQTRVPERPPSPCDRRDARRAPNSALTCREGQWCVSTAPQDTRSNTIPNTQHFLTLSLSNVRCYAKKSIVFTQSVERTLPESAQLGFSQRAPPPTHTPPRESHSERFTHTPMTRPRPGRGRAAHLPPGQTPKPETSFATANNNGGRRVRAWLARVATGSRGCVRKDAARAP